MMPDLIDQVFGPGPEDEFYPGSRRKLAPLPPSDDAFVDSPWRFNYSVKTIRGEEIKMYPIGALATALSVSVPTIRYWNRMGYIPTAPYRLPKNMIIKGKKTSGRRLYTEAMIDVAVAAFERRGLLAVPRIEWSKHPDLPIEIEEEWSRIFNQPTSKRSN